MPRVSLLPKGSTQIDPSRAQPPLPLRIGLPPGGSTPRSPAGPDPEVLKSEATSGWDPIQERRPPRSVNGTPQGSGESTEGVSSD